MTTPALPDSPQPAEGPADLNPWAPPSPGQGEGRSEGGGEAQGQGETPGPVPGPAAPVLAAPVPAPGEAPGAPYWPPYAMPAPPPRNGLGTAAMVLGIVGTVLGLAIILFWLSWLPALLAVIFGAIGLGNVRKGLATNRGMALAGVILGIGGLLVSVGAGVFVVSRVQVVADEQRAERNAARARSDAAIEAAEERAAKERERIEAERKRLEAEREKEAADERARRLTFGQSYTYGDGLKVTMAAPEPYALRGNVTSAPKNAKVVQIRITVVNTGSAPVSLDGSGMPVVRDARGNLVFILIDGSGRMKLLSGSLAPGQEATGLSAYALPEDAADPFSVNFVYGSTGQRKNVVWSGSAG
ncbi:DUF4190 domain-containing protein [Kitasatospora sp. NPDC091207]|uniref:DUF4190 domain-containing protein n=1 Tax=Kitasatospora sp. NPDC091207 TaxID=3364083 RepID=UPI0038229092